MLLMLHMLRMLHMLHMLHTLLLPMLLLGQTLKLPTSGLVGRSGHLQHPAASGQALTRPCGAKPLGGF